MIGRITKSKNDSSLTALEKRIIVLEKIILNLSHIADNNKEFSDGVGDYVTKSSSNPVFNENAPRRRSTIRLTNNQMIAELAAAIRRASQRNL